MRIAPGHRVAVAAVHDDAARRRAELRVSGGDELPALDLAQPAPGLLGEPLGSLLALALQRQVDVVVVDEHGAEARSARFPLHSGSPALPLGHLIAANAKSKLRAGRKAQTDKPVYRQHEYGRRRADFGVRRNPPMQRCNGGLRFANLLCAPDVQRAVAPACGDDNKTGRGLQAAVVGCRELHLELGAAASGPHLDHTAPQTYARCRCHGPRLVLSLPGNSEGSWMRSPVVLEAKADGGGTRHPRQKTRYQRPYAGISPSPIRSLFGWHLAAHHPPMWV